MMPKTALMFGSIGTIAETSDLQRQAYNEAMAEAGLDWHWERETYAELLTQAGGKERLAHLAAATGKALSDDIVEQIHARKTELACAKMILSKVPLRPGVAATISHAKTIGLKLAFVTTTYQPNIDAMFAISGSDLVPSDFEVIVTRDLVGQGKPSPDAYHVALKALGIAPDAAVAIEDTAISVMSAKRAGLYVVATPGAITKKSGFLAG